MMMTPEDAEELKQRAVALATALQEGGGWPLNKRETMTAFILMGLTSRLQPVNADNAANRSRLVKLGIDVADEALAQINKDPSK